MKRVYVCTHCGSSNIEVRTWVNPNTREVSEDELITVFDDECYCNNCESMRDYKIETIIEEDEVYVIGDSCLKGNCD